jgi:hypothetical protein
VTDDDVDPEERYGRVLSVVEAQTSPMQRPGVRPRAVYTVLVAHSSYTYKGVKASLQAILDNGDVIAYNDDDGELRFCRLEADPVERLVAEYPEVADNDTIQSVLEAADD